MCLVELRRKNLHLVVEDLGLAGLGRGDQMLIEDLKDVFADLSELLLDCLAVFLDEFDLRLIAFGFLLLLDRCDDSPRGSASADDVLVGDREEISLFDREFLVCRCNDLHVLDHFCARSATRDANRGRKKAHLHSARLAQQALPSRLIPRHPCLMLIFGELVYTKKHL